MVVLYFKNKAFFPVLFILLSIIFLVITYTGIQQQKVYQSKAANRPPTPTCIPSISHNCVGCVCQVQTTCGEKSQSNCRNNGDSCNDPAPPLLTYIYNSAMNVSLVVDQSSGPSPLNIKFTVYSGSSYPLASSPDYYLWWNCPSSSFDLSALQTECGSLPNPPSGTCQSNDVGATCKQMTLFSRHKGDPPIPPLVTHTYTRSGYYQVPYILALATVLNRFDRPVTIGAHARSLVYVNCSSSPSPTPGRPTLTPTPTPIETPTPIPSGGPSPTSGPSPTPGPFGQSGNIALNLKLRFQGIVSQPKITTMQVRVTLSGGDLAQPQQQTSQFSAGADGVWTGNVSFNATPRNDYFLLVKGPKHVQKKICSSNPTENNPGIYSCSNGTISLSAGQNSLDASKIILFVGDLSPQDGIVDSYDISYVGQHLGSTDSQALTIGDLNLDGIVDSQDYSLIIAALGIKYDEQ